MTTSTPSGPTRDWQLAKVERIVSETFRVKTYTFRLPKWRPFRAGQHYDVRLTASDGYQAQRSYSIASPPEREGTIDLTIELIKYGEVSPYFHDVVEIGDTIEMRGPIGGPFTRTSSQGGPLLLVAGGSGIVPLMSMARHRKASAPETPGLILFSSRTFDHIIYREELDNLNNGQFKVLHTLTRDAPKKWTGLSGRIDARIMDHALGLLDLKPKTFIAGSSPFVETSTRAALEAGVAFDDIRTEHFGPSAE